MPLFEWAQQKIIDQALSSLDAYQSHQYAGKQLARIVANLKESEWSQIWMRAGSPQRAEIDAFIFCAVTIRTIEQLQCSLADAVSLYNSQLPALGAIRNEVWQGKCPADVFPANYRGEKWVHTEAGQPQIIKDSSWTLVLCRLALFPSLLKKYWRTQLNVQNVIRDFYRNGKNFTRFFESTVYQFLSLYSHDHDNDLVQLGARLYRLEGTSGAPVDSEWKQKYDELMSGRSTVDARSDELQNQVIEWKSSNAALRGKISDLENRCADAITRAQNSEKLLEESTRESARVRNSYDILKGECKVLSDRCQSLENENQELGRQVESSRDAYERVRQDLALAAQKVETTQHESERVQQDLVAARVSHDKVMQQLRDMEISWNQMDVDLKSRNQTVERLEQFVAKQKKAIIAFQDDGPSSVTFANTTPPAPRTTRCGSAPTPQAPKPYLKVPFPPKLPYPEYNSKPAVVSTDQKPEIPNNDWGSWGTQLEQWGTHLPSETKEWGTWSKGGNQPPPSSSGWMPSQTSTEDPNRKALDNSVWA